MDLDTDQQKEYNRQRDYLEKSVDSLKRKLEKDSHVHRIDNMRIMGENVSLIREINDLRREINALKHERTQQEVNAMSQSTGSIRHGDQSPQAALETRELTTQRDEIAALTRHLQELQSTAPRLSTPGSRLPPLQGAPTILAPPAVEAPVQAETAAPVVATLQQTPGAESAEGTAEGVEVGELPPVDVDGTDEQALLEEAEPADGPEAAGAETEAGAGDA
jgi:hypothetical protein